MQQSDNNDILSGARARLVKAKPDSLSAEFGVFCRAALEAKAAGQIPPQQAAMAIAGCMFVDNLDADPLREEITMMAGELEVPQDRTETSERWLGLERLVVELEDSSRAG